MSSSGMNYAPSSGRPAPVCGPGEFVVAAIGLDHGHIYGMCNGLREAGATLRWVWDADPAKMGAFRQAYPEVRAARSEQEILEDPEVQLVAGARIPVERAALGFRVMDHGKHYFTDKPPLTTVDQLQAARDKVAETGKKYAVYYSERLHVESAVLAGRLIADGALGRVIQVMGTGPHRLSAASRPAWHWVREQSGGILCDIGSHQLEQVLFFGGTDDAIVAASRVANFAHQEHPTFEDFGDVTVTLANGCVGYSRVDWFTPDGLSTWGDGRTVILGTEGYIELRKYVDVAREQTTDHLYLVDGQGEQHLRVAGTIGFPFFGELILDCLQGTEIAMTQDHAFRAIELALQAEAGAVHLTS